MLNVDRFYVEDGNTVRKINEPLPSIEERRQREEKLRKIELLKNNRKKAVIMRRNKLKTVYFSLLIISFCILFGSYVNMQTKIQECKREIALLEGQISDIRAKNMSKRNRINADTNLEKVKDYAINKLKMTYATPDKIVYYNIKNDDYMTQYKDLP